MEGASKKRKIFHENEEAAAAAEDGDGEDDDEEKKMEKFFALIKSIREARDQLIQCSEEFQVINKKKKQKTEEQKPNNNNIIATWNPSFQREDFMDDAQLRITVPPAVTLVGTSQITKEGTEKEDNIKEGLDLKLSL